MNNKWNRIREEAFDIIELDNENNIASKVYDWLMVFLILVSLLPLAFKEELPIFKVIDGVCAPAFAVDYILRWLTADYKLKKGVKSFIRYPFTLMAIIDLLSVLPYYSPANVGFRILRVLRMSKALKALRMFKMLRYSRSINIISNVIRKQKVPLLAVCSLAGAYILVSALAVFNVEPDTFDDFFDAVYWATISLTTLGYGDIYPVSTAGRAITMISTIVGMAVIALPSGIITAGYIHELNEIHDPEGALDNLESYVKL